MSLSRTGLCRRTFFTLVVSVSYIAQGLAQSAAHLTATYRHGELSLALVHPSMRAGSGVLTAEILAPEGGVLGRAEQERDSQQQ